MNTHRVVLEGPRRTLVRAGVLPPLQNGDVLLKVIQCGVCTTEVHQWLGHASDYPIAVGHEIVGRVEELCGDIAHLRLGDHVVGWIPGGGMAEHVVARAAHVFAISPELPQAAAAEPLSCCVNTVELVNPPAGARVLIIGTGFISSLLQQLSRQYAPHSLVVAGRSSSGLARATDTGATHTVNLRTQDLGDALGTLTDGQGVDIVYEATGSQNGLTLAEGAACVEGTLAIVGYHQDGPRSINLELWNRRALRIANAHFRDLTTILNGMRRGMELVTAGTIDPGPLYTHRFALSEAPEAFRTAARRPEGFIKAVIEPEG